MADEHEQDEPVLSLHFDKDVPGHEEVITALTESEEADEGCPAIPLLTDEHGHIGYIITKEQYEAAKHLRGVMDAIIDATGDEDDLNSAMEALDEMAPSQDEEEEDEPSAERETFDDEDEDDDKEGGKD